MAALTVDVSNLSLGTRLRLRDVLHREDMAKKAIAMAAQARLIQDLRGSVAPGTTKDGIGPLSLVLHPYFASYFRRVYGERIFDDPEFIEYLKRRGEWFHLPEAGTRPQVGYRRPSSGRPCRTVTLSGRGDRIVKERIVYA